MMMARGAAKDNARPPPVDVGFVSSNALLACAHVIPDISWSRMGPRNKPLVWLHGEIKTPPFSQEARIQAGYLLRELQRGATLALPHSRPMPEVGVRCHELRIIDQGVAWRMMYRIDVDAIVLVAVFSKKTQRTPKAVLDACRRRLREYDDA